MQTLGDSVQSGRRAGLLGAGVGALALAFMGVEPARRWARRLLHDPAPEAVPVAVMPAPTQVDLAVPQALAMRHGARIVGLSRFRVNAVVLGARRYRWDRLSRWSPIDLALGWGQLNADVLRGEIRWRQSARWYTFFVDGELPFSARAIGRMSANMHMIPATDWIAEAVTSAAAGERIEAQGYLCAIELPNGSSVRSSLSRDDSGAGACEVVWVTSWRNYSTREYAVAQDLFDARPLSG